MGRKRKSGTEWLPDRVYIGRSAYEFKPAKNVTIRLCPLSASKRAVMQRWQEELNKYESKAGSFLALVDDYFKSEKFKSLAPATQKKYNQNSVKVLSVFGRVSANQIKPEHVRKYMDLRGAEHPVAANREKAFMSAVYTWAYQRGKVSVHPVKGVERFTEVARDRYITDEEYQAVLDHADPIVAAVMEISYCCAARVSDVLSLTRDQMTTDGLLIKQGKTGKKQIKRWSDRLRGAIERAKSAQVTPSLRGIVATESGSRLTYDAFRARWVESLKEAKKAHPNLRFDFTFHDIKAKSISDYDGNRQRFSGHKSASQVAAYERKPDIVDTH